MLRHEVKYSQNPAHNKQVHDDQVYALQSAQSDLWYEFDWPYMMVDRDLDVVAQQRYVEPHADIGIDDIRCIYTRYGGDWCPLLHGIGPDQYSAWDSDLLETSVPIERWRIYEGREIEIWPLPPTASDSTTLEGKLRIHGKKKLPPLIDEDDQCELDARDIVLFAASKYAKGDLAKEINAKWKLRHADIRAGLSSGQSVQMFGIGGTRHEKTLRGPPRVHYRVSS